MLVLDLTDSWPILRALAFPLATPGWQKSPDLAEQSLLSPPCILSFWGRSIYLTLPEATCLLLRHVAEDSTRVDPLFQQSFLIL